VVGQNTKYKTGDFADFVFCILSCHVCCGETKNKNALIPNLSHPRVLWSHRQITYHTHCKGYEV
jgi:hypothetical protein